jgi:hypothetical protein
MGVAVAYVFTAAAPPFQTQPANQPESLHMNIFVLPNEERVSSGFTHRVELTHADLTETAANTAQTIAILTVAAGDMVRNCATKLVIPFEDASDNALNTTTLIVGDDGSTNRYLASQELNLNGTEIDAKAGVATGHVFTAANTIDAIFGSMAAKSLSDIDAGEVHIFLAITELNKLSKAIV